MNEKVRAYLTGELSEDEEVRLEEEYFSDDEKFLEFQAAQNDLLDAYARGHLDARRRQGFEKRLAASPWLRERAALAEALAQAVDRNHAGAAETVKRPAARPAFFDLLKNFLGALSPPLRVTLAAAMLLVLAAGVAVVVSALQLRRELAALEARRQQEQQQTAEKVAQVTEAEQRAEQLNRELEQERTARAALEAQLNRATPQSAAPPPLVSFVLSPQVLRDSGAKRLVLPRGAASVELRLRLPEPRAGVTFSVDVTTLEGEVIAGRKALRSEANGMQVALRLRAARLATGDYLVKLKANDEEVANYVLRITRQ
ncbi:MAG TPA: hypothetical protein VKA60_26665 [Blastocatellia bacterium]|nr:hypothetical protein [Blastocatellia bacterium]